MNYWDNVVWNIFEKESGLVVATCSTFAQARDVLYKLHIGYWIPVYSMKIEERV
jgi:hypothetical protein